MSVRIDVYTIFPEIIEHYCAQSIVGRAQQGGFATIEALDIRDGADDARRTIDDTPVGGGAGMVMKPGPIYSSLRDREALRGPARPIIALVPHGTPFRQRDAERLSTLESFSLLCGRYEGIDQRVLDDLVDEEISLGDFVLAGGELAALSVIEAVVRLVPGVLGNEASSLDESFSGGLLEYPQWTKPSDFEGQAVPEILLSGDHAKIEAWRRREALKRTQQRRPDLLEARGGLTPEELALLASEPQVESEGKTG
jgi:tRNA (guanine37-N1)-methyltransferase